MNFEHLKKVSILLTFLISIGIFSSISYAEKKLGYIINQDAKPLELRAEHFGLKKLPKITLPKVTLDEIKIFSNNNNLKLSDNVKLKSGKVITVKTALEELNKVENGLNAEGYSLRTDAIEQLKKTGSKAILNSSLVKNLMVKVPSIRLPKTLILKSLPKQTAPIFLIRGDSSKINFHKPNFSHFGKLSPQRLKIHTIKRRPGQSGPNDLLGWGYQKMVGKKSKFALDFDLKLSIFYDDKTGEAGFKAEGVLDCYILNQKFNFAYGTAKVSFNFKTGLANLNAHFEAISIDIYDLDKKNQTNFKLAEDFKLGKLEVVVPARFFGIINVGIGVKGALGIKTGVDINKTDGLCLQITPYAGLDVFAFASIDIVIASGGVRATLKLVTASIPIKACAKPVLSQGKLSSIDLSTFGNIDANFLKGSIEIYYVIDVLFYHKEGSVELWSSKGIPLKQEIYKATKRINVKSDSTTAPRYKPMLKVPLYKK